MTTEINNAVKIAVLETKYQAMDEKLDDVIKKLDTLLELKTKGMGALGLVSLILGSGVIGVVLMIINLFKGGSSHFG